ncbi:hypothetical protein NDU88_003209 [Pleurodeles waltl]|uniref:Uncharacterized protein n=1 Tax=Pleurodeles waltl TaxID=8319 RepID=A0AAV7LGE1_PLEWA|nr:hypothetical protein NDU88_003209 [Pleurodeles waltl]
MGGVYVHSRCSRLILSTGPGLTLALPGVASSALPVLSDSPAPAPFPPRPLTATGPRRIAPQLQLRPPAGRAGRKPGDLSRPWETPPQPRDLQLPRRLSRGPESPTNSRGAGRTSLSASARGSLLAPGAAPPIREPLPLRFRLTADHRRPAADRRTTSAPGSSQTGRPQTQGPIGTAQVQGGLLRSPQSPFRPQCLSSSNRP